MGVWLGPRGLPKNKQPPKFTVNGVSYDGKHDVDDNPAFRYWFRTDPETKIVYWEMAFWQTCDFSFQRVVDEIDLFIVGPGADGGEGQYVGSGIVEGGPGGNGGEVKNFTGQTIRAGDVCRAYIGSPGSDSSTNVTRATIGQNQYVARCGIGNGPDNGLGGVGGKVADNNPLRVGQPGKPGVLTFGGTVSSDADAAWAQEKRHIWYPVFFGAGGGGGGARSNGQHPTIVAAGSGGRSNGGTGGTYDQDGKSAAQGEDQKNHGAGGGGAGFSSGYSRIPGAGCPGVIMIRNAR